MMCRHSGYESGAGATGVGGHPSGRAGGRRDDGPGPIPARRGDLPSSADEMRADGLRSGADPGPSGPGDLLDARGRTRVIPRLAGGHGASAIEGRKPTVCHLLDRSDPVEAEVPALQLARQLRADYQFTFVCLGEPGPPLEGPDLEGARIHVIGRRPGLDWDCARRLGRLLRRERVDLLHAHQSGAFLQGMIARLFYRRPPVLFTEHERRYPDVHSPERVVMSRMLLEGRDRVVAASQSVRRALILNGGLPPERVGVIYNGIIPPQVIGAAGDGASVRREIGVDADALLILQPARFDPLQNHALAIRALGHVVRGLPQARLALVGEGPELGIIRDLVRQRGLESHVLFLGPRGDHVRLLAAADLFLLTGLCEGVPAVLVQALAAGRPVVATRAGGVSEIVEDRACGLLACPGDHGGLADHILRLGASRELREQFGRRGRERIEALSSEANTSLLYSDIYRTMLAR